MDRRRTSRVGIECARRARARRHADSSRMRRSSTKPKRASSRPRNRFWATVRSGASRISWWTRTMPRCSASTGPVNVIGFSSRKQAALGGREMARQDAHQGRFAGAVLADDRVDLAGCELERNVAQNLDRSERFRDAVCTKYDCHQGPRLSASRAGRIASGPAARVRIDALCAVRGSSQARAWAGIHVLRFIARPLRGVGSLREARHETWSTSPHVIDYIHFTETASSVKRRND